jgi:glutamine synthetase
MFVSASECLEYICNNDVAMVDLKVVGVRGRWLHITLPARRVSETLFHDGVGYDGSSGAGFRSVEDGDVAAVPEPQTAFIDPFFDLPTLSLLCRTVRADTKDPFPSDPRTIAQRAVAHMRQGGIADVAWMAPEYEFYVFDRVKVVNERYRMAVEIDAPEVSNSGTATTVQPMQGYLCAPPTEQLHDIRNEITSLLEQMGVAVRYHHHEVGACGQCEIEVEGADLVTAADRAMLVKYVAKNVARRHQKLATFMPKPVYGEAGSGMHVHQKLDRAGKPLFHEAGDRRYANLSDTALHYVAGLLEHGRALTGLTNPSTNSFKRLIPGFEAPVNLFFSLANRSAAIRVPRYATAPQEKRIEYRPADFSCNVYLALAAMLMAGIDGIVSKIDVAKNHFGPFDVDLAKQGQEFVDSVTPLPRSLGEALDALDADHTFLTRGEVFAESFLRAWIDTVRRHETVELARRPHPYEYHLYLDA